MLPYGQEYGPGSQDPRRRFGQNLDTFGLGSLRVPHAGRELGLLRGKLWVADDFGAPLPNDIQKYFDGTQFTMVPWIHSKLLVLATNFRRMGDTRPRGELRSSRVGISWFPHSSPISSIPAN